jgi:hypothetical protein
MDEYGTGFTLIDHRMNDGSRKFLELPQTVYPDAVVEHLLLLEGAKLSGFIDSIPESWIDFRLRGHEFTINNQFGELWFFVKDPGCPTAVLASVAAHFATI